MKLITHSNSFHYDEVLATAFLQQIYSDTTLIRSRIQSVIDEGDIVYDVGNVFDAKRNRFDHHMASFTETFSEKYKIKLSSAGLIFKYFHEELFERKGFRKDHFLYNYIVEKVYEEYFLSADAIDNGYDIFGEIKPRTMADLVESFNYSGPLGQDYESKQYNRFMEVLEIVKTDLKNYLDYIFINYIPSYTKLYENIKNCAGSIFVSDTHADTSMIFDIDKLLQKNLKFIVLKSNDMFRIYALRVSKTEFKSRLPLCSSWRGLRGEELIRACKVPDAIFVHASGFTGGAMSLEGALKMCEMTLQLENQK